MTTGLVLTGGGARGAYQVGALRALVDVVGNRSPFGVVVGTSAGAINAAAVATSTEELGLGMAKLESTWRALSPDRVYRTDVPALAAIAAGWLRELGGGGCLGPPDVNALLDTTPLRALLREALPMTTLPQLIRDHRLHGVGLTATSYHTGSAVTFFDGDASLAGWSRASRIGRRAVLTVDHVLASAAIPLFFPPISVGGEPYGDGCVRLAAPLSPAVHLGAGRILAISVRSGAPPLPPVMPFAPPSPAEIAGVLLDAVFLDSLEGDTERMLRINATLDLMPEAQRRAQALRTIPLLVLRPSRNLGTLAVEQYRELPLALRYLLRGIGADGRRGWNLISYLAFEPAYVDRLIDLGYEDTRARRAEIEAFMERS